MHNREIPIVKAANLKVFLATALLLAAIAAPAAKQSELPQVTEDGLHMVPDSKMAIVYAEPGADLAVYDRVMLLEPYVAFKKNWERSQSRSAGTRMRISSKDVEKIKNNLAQEFQVVFEEVLRDGGYEVVEEPAEDVLLVRPAIINLDVTAPDIPTASRTMTYTTSAGEMTLYIEIYDSVTGDLIAKALDRRVDNSRSGYYTWTSSVTNRAAAKKILKGWAQILLDALNEAKN